MLGQEVVGVSILLAHASAQVGVQALVLEGLGQHQRDAVERRRQSRFVGAGDRVQILADDLLSQWTRQRFHAVAVVEEGLRAFIDLGRDTAGPFVQQRGARLVGRDAQHGRRVGGVPVLRAVGAPLGAPLGEFVHVHRALAPGVSVGLGDLRMSAFCLAVSGFLLSTIAMICSAVLVPAKISACHVGKLVLNFSSG